MKKGFSLVEIMITTSIITILITVTSGIAYISQMQRTYDAVRKSNLKDIRSALEVFYREKGRYPNANEIGTAIVGNDAVSKICGDTPAMQRYIFRLPCDPENDKGKDYIYYVFNANQDFAIFTNITNKDDIAVEQSICKNGCSYLLTNGYLAPEKFNYALFSSLDYMKTAVEAP